MLQAFGISKKTFRIFRFPRFIEIPTILNSLFMNTAKRLLFGTQENSYVIWLPLGFTTDRSRNIKITNRNLKLSKFKKWHVMFCNRYLYHISKSPFMFFDRYSSYIHDFGNCIRRIFITVRCPSLQKIAQFWKSRHTEIIFV